MIKEYIVTGTSGDVDIGASWVDELAQNVRTIISTWRGSVFLDRNFGINPAIIDQPENMILANLTVDVTNQIGLYEPRVEVTGVDFERSDTVSGTIIPTVRFVVKEGALI